MTATATAIGSVDSLPAIGLDELNRAAELQTRIDRKYLAPPADIAALVAALPDARALDVDGARRIPYASTYYDTPDLASYRLAATGRRRRFKVRQRTYVEQGLSFLEVKTRGPRGATVKQRTPTAGRTRAELDDFVDCALRDAAIEGVDPRTLLPVLVTRYVRSTLHLPADGARVTIDSGLTWASPSGGSGGTPLLVAETKTGARPSAADRVLWSLGRRPARLSKYGTAMAALNADLPGNRWHRTLLSLDDAGHCPPAHSVSAEGSGERGRRPGRDAA